MIPNILAERYASTDMARLWSPEYKVVLERQLWVAVLKAQRDLGIEVPEGAVEAYEAAVDQVDLGSIAAREKVTRHDVKARIEEFSALAGHQQIHKGMTSRDLTENVEQLQIRESLQMVRDKTVATLARLGQSRPTMRVGDGRDGVTMLPRKQPPWVRDLQVLPMSCSWPPTDMSMTCWLAIPLRGMKGPVGTAQDMLDMFDGDEDKLDELEEQIARHLGFDQR